eukprot:scaffold7650_cov439-Pinguiococcus_pyrenoidosus.AAC.2
MVANRRAPEASSQSRGDTSSTPQASATSSTVALSRSILRTDRREERVGHKMWRAASLGAPDRD